MQQLVNEPSHILPHSSSCIDLIFTDQPSLVVSSGAHPSLRGNCHHQITYCKLNLKIEYPPPYQRLVWNFKKAKNTSIRKAIHTVNWKFLFFNKSVPEQVSIFNDTLMNIFSNYIPNKFVIIGNTDPPWMTERIKNKMFKKNCIYKSYISNGKTAIDYQKLHDIGSEISQMISKRKKEYYDQLSKKLNDPLTSSKTYWSILKTFCSGTKIPLIPSIIIDNKAITNLEKRQMFLIIFLFRNVCPL